jgi:cytochrome c oxidase accessory protein FixG
VSKDNIEDFIFQSEEFRDSIATVSKEGKRVWLFPKMPSGKYYNYRKLVSYILLAIFFGLPFIKFNGNPIFMLNIIERKFIIWGIVFHPQDFHLFLFTLLSFILFIILFTVVFGRLFCGWVCPQTIFMEMVFRRIEYAIDGDWSAQKKLSESPWTTDKIKKRVLKHFIFFTISVIISNLFLSYIIGVDEVIKIISDPISMHLSGFIAMIVFSYVFYGVYAYMREQVCTTICPYGRLQGVMLDKNSIAISYDWKRGEPRGKLKKSTSPNTMVELPILGDCVDCSLCVKVCPTGIDIRNGTQLECVNCTACIDACDEVMTKINKPTGLIRYDSHNGIATGVRKIFTARVIAYSFVLLALLGITSFMLINRSDVETLILKTPGTLFIEGKDGYISNLYNYELINKSNENQKIEFILNHPNSKIEFIGRKELFIKKDSILTGTMFLKIKNNSLNKRKTRVEIIVKSNKDSEVIVTNFLGPFK